MANSSELELMLKPSGWETSRFIEGRIAPKDEKLLRKLAKAIKHPDSPTSSYNIKEIVLMGLGGLGLASVVEFVGGCALGSQVAYPKGAPWIISDYGSMAGVNNLPRRTPHNAIDIQVYRGDAVLAPADGVVVRSMWRTYGGNVILIEHGQDTEGSYLMTGYAHNERNLVKYGEKVRRGQKVAEVGATGLGAFGVNHLHFEVWVAPSPGGAGNSEAEWDNKWKHTDPHKYWYDGPNKITCFDSARNYQSLPVMITYPVECKR